MKKWFVLLLIVGFLTACQSNKTVPENDDDGKLPGITESDIVQEIADLEAIPFDEVPDERKMRIDRRVLTNEMIFYGDHEVITSTDDQTVLFDVNENDPIWEQDIGGHSIYQTVKDGLYYVNGQDGVFALSADTGDIKQVYPYENISSQSLFVYDDYVITSHLEELTVYDQASGDVLWRHPVDDMIITPTELDDVFLIKVDDNVITAFDKETGKIIHTFDGKNELYNQGFLLQDQILVFREDLDDLETIFLDVYDAGSFEDVQEIAWPRTGLKPHITENELYFYHNSRAMKAIDGALEKEHWRLDDTDTAYDFVDFTADNNGLHVLVRNLDEVDENEDGTPYLYYLHLDATDGSVVQYVALDGAYERDITYHFYTHDDKTYIKLVHNGKNVYYILAVDDVHKSF